MSSDIIKQNFELRQENIKFKKDINCKIKSHNYFKVKKS